MAYDCYCAICGVGFCGMHIETPSQTSLERRQRWIEKRYRAREASKNNNCQVPHDPSEDHDDPVRSYDPRLVGWDNISWLYKAYCLGSNPQPSGKTKYIMSPAVVLTSHSHRPGRLFRGRVITQTLYANKHRKGKLTEWSDF